MNNKNVINENIEQENITNFENKMSNTNYNKVIIDLQDNINKVMCT